MGFAELFEIGFFSAFIIWSNFGLTAAIYVGVGISFALQYLLLKKMPPCLGTLLDVCA